MSRINLIAENEGLSGFRYILGGESEVGVPVSQ